MIERREAYRADEDAKDDEYRDEKCVEERHDKKLVEVRGVEPLSKQIIVSDDTHAFVPISSGQISGFILAIKTCKT